jgi:glycosyltransferase involved in cell wall biosynthesis
MSRRIAVAYAFNDSDWYGGRNYFGSLFRALRAVGAPDLQMHLVIGHRTETTLPEEFPELEILKTSLMDRMHPSWLARQVGLRTLDTDPLLASFLRRKGIDLLTHSAQLGPNPGLKTAAWLYDFQFMHLPELWQRRHIQWAEQRYRAACRNADAIIVSSSQALDDLDRFAKWCDKPKHVLRFVSNPIDFGALPDEQEIKKKYSLPERYFYLPNQFWANKNHRLVIDALARLRANGVDATVICTGKTHDGRQPQYFGELMAYVSQSGLDESFRVLGLVPYADTQALMAHSVAMINPSLFEGWSTTVEEAKTMQRRMLLADIPVHREQCARGARFFDPADPAALAELMQAALADELPPLDPAAINSDYDVRLKQFGEAFLEIVDSVLA